MDFIGHCEQTYCTELNCMWLRQQSDASVRGCIDDNRIYGINGTNRMFQVECAALMLARALRTPNRHQPKLTYLNVHFEASFTIV